MRRKVSRLLVSTFFGSYTHDPQQTRANPAPTGSLYWPVIPAFLWTPDVVTTICLGGAVDFQYGTSCQGERAMHVVTTERRVGGDGVHATLLRRSYREDGEGQEGDVGEPLAPAAGGDRRDPRVLRGETLIAAGDAFEIERSLPAGHVNAALAMARRLGLAGLLDARACRERDLCMAMIVGRVLAPASKLGTVRALGQSTLPEELNVEGCDEDDLYGAMDWLLERQQRIEDRLARRHLKDGEMVLYDVSSSYFEGRVLSVGEAWLLARR